jgi:predicted transcriptional regulator
MAVMTVRLDDGLAMRLRLVAEVEERPMSDVISEAVADYCSHALEAPAFRTRAEQYIGKLQGVLEARP